MTDKIAEIRARHQEGVRAGADADRAYLLAEVERLIRERDWARADVDQLRGDREKMLLDERDFVRKHRAEIERLTRERDEARAEVERLRAENERLHNEDTKTRHALRGWVWVCPDGGDEPTHERVSAVVAEVEKLRDVLKTVRINGPDAQGLVWLSFSREGGVRVSFVVGHKEKMVSQALLEFEQIRRNALEVKT